ncbi:MAG: HAMP domain-containing protein [Clostridia bacterium]|nr:HAMP domain-containing protein [Clostridia bacterium]
MTNSASQIETLYSYESETFAKDVYAIALNNEFCISVFGPDGKVLTTADIGGGCMIHNTDMKMINELYNDALENGGEYFHRAGLTGFQDKKAHVPFANSRYDVRDRILYVAIQEVTDGQLIMMFDAAVEPVNVVKGVITIHLLITTIIMTLVAAFVANALAKKLSQPIADVNRAAKKLTAGEYDVEFTGEGYREIYELSDTLNQTAHDLKRTDMMQKELIANISHDLRTPLTLITGYCEMMRDIDGENNPENIQVVLDETARLSSLVNDLIDLSKYESGSQKLNIESVDLDFLLLETVERYRKLMTDKDFTFIYESVGPTFARCDKKRILQVIYNLVNNAINYSGDDKTVILKLSVTEQGKNLVEVTDHGEGIAKEDLPLIFDRYYKVDKVHKRAVTGTGLGLSIVKGILESHGASYGVRSEIGTGSTFFFEI